MKIPSVFSLAIATIAVGGVLAAGCGESTSQDPASQQKNVENAKTMRSYFDKAGGNYESLSAAAKDAYIQQCGSEEKAMQNWNLMKFGPGAADRSVPKSNGPAGQ